MTTASSRASFSRNGPQVDTMCDVVLIKKDDGLTPRLSFWKKDKTKGEVEDLTEEELVKEGRTILIKARVDMKDCQKNYWKLNDFLHSCKEVQLPTPRVPALLPLTLWTRSDGHHKAAVLTAVRTYLGGKVTEEDVQMLVDRRATLEDFRRLLDEPDYFAARKGELGVHGDEAVWQAFFEANPWIFGYGLTLVACQKYDEKKLERMTTGANVFTGGGKQSDAVMRTMGFVQSLLFGEIKKHSTPPTEAGAVSRAGRLPGGQRTQRSGVAGFRRPPTRRFETSTTFTGPSLPLARTSSISRQSGLGR